MTNFRMHIYTFIRIYPGKIDYWRSKLDMKTILIPASAPEMLSIAQKILRQGGLVALPTDTVYGLGALAFDGDAVGKIYTAKGRSNEKAIPILVGDPSDLEKVTSNVPRMAMILAEHFWPGALTLVVPKHPSIPVAVTSMPSVGVRVPNHPVTRSILRTAGPMAVTSANLSGGEDAATAREVLEQLDGRINLIIDAGPVGFGLASTVVSCLGTEPVILREGPITIHQINAALGIL
jgi:L-threonylcarbamoyladenylate synthase